MIKGRSGRSAITAAALGGFLAGAITMAVVLLGFSSLLRPPALNSVRQDAPSSTATAGPKVIESAPRPLPRPSISSDPLILPTAAMPTISAGPVSELRDRKLEVPVRGVDRSDLRDSFNEARRSTQNHEAIDILAPRNTPVLAVEDGTIVKLFDSKTGRDDALPVRSHDQVRVLLRPSRTLRGRHQRRQPPPARAGARLCRHVGQRAQRHAAPALCDLPAHRQEGVVAGHSD